MKKKSIIIALSLVLVLILITSSTISTFAISLQSSTISGKINFDESQFSDVTKLKLNIFRLTLVEDNTTSSKYAHIYEKSVFPDKNGNIKFSRPSQYCYIEVDLDSIPSGFGVSQNSILISANDNGFAINISAISDFTIDFNNDNIEFLDSKKNSLFVNQKHEVIYDDNFKNDFLKQTDNQKGNTSNKNTNIKCTLGNFTIESQQSVESLSLAKRIEFLHKKGLISAEERVVQYINGLKSGNISEHLDVEKAFSLLSDYRINNELTQEMDDSISTLVNDYMPTYENEAILTYGYFDIHYEEGEVSSRNLSLTKLYLNHAKTTLCGTFKFETPAAEPGKTRYQVYLNNSQGSSGYNIAFDIDGKKYSYIVINYTDGQTEFDNFKIGTICHEFTHAVQIEYATNGEVQHETELINFNESVASAIKARLVPNSGTGIYIEAFQQTPELSLFSVPSSGAYIYRQYGVMLFPLYLAQEYSDLNTIRQIYEEHRIVRNIYTAIDNVLQDADSSFSEAYAQFALYNYNIQNYYSCAESTWTAGPKKTTVYSNSYSHYFPLLSSRYFEFTGSQNTTFAISFHSPNYINYSKLQQISTVGDELIESDHSIPTSSMTILINLEADDKTCFVLSNISLTSSMMCSVRTL